MKSKFLLILAVTGLCVFSYGANIIKNGNFIEKNADGFAADWQKKNLPQNSGATVRLDNTNSKSGGQSICITNPDEKCYTRIEQLHIPCKPRTKYVARFWTKGQNIQSSQKGGARMFIGPYGELSRPIMQFGPDIELLSRNVPYPHNYGWTLYESNVFSSGSSSELGVTLYFRHASGTVWFDNVEIVEFTPDEKRNREAERSRKLIRDDIAQVRKIAPELDAELKKLEVEVQKFFPTVRDPRAGMPFFAPQRELGRIFSRVLQKKFKTSNIIISAVNDPLKAQSAYILPDGQYQKNIVLEGLKNEVETFSLNLTNPAANSKLVKIEIPEKLELEAYNVIHVETDRRIAVDDALLPLKKESAATYSVKVPGGMTCQIYFSAKLKYADSGIIRVNGNEIKIEYRPKNTLFPEDLPITLFSYAYPYRYSFIEHLEKARKLRYHMHNNGAMPYQFCSPIPYFDAKGKFIPSKTDWGKLDVILSMTPAPQRLIINAPVYSPAHIKEFLGTDNGKPIALFSAEWERRIGIWLKHLTQGLARRGITYKDFCISLIDEPGDNRLEYMKKTAAVIKKIDKNIRVYNNFNHGISHKNIGGLAEALDIIAPEIAEMSSDKMQILKKSGKEIWCYHVQNRSYPADKMRDIFHVLRKEDVKGFSYWCFYDSSPRWMPTGGQSYAIFYDGADNKWYPSKRAEGIREGMEIYTILSVLKEQNEKQYKNLCAKIGKLSHSELRKEALKFIK